MQRSKLVSRAQLAKWAAFDGEKWERTETGMPYFLFCADCHTAADRWPLDRHEPSCISSAHVPWHYKFKVVGARSQAELATDTMALPSLLL